jgi:hypothetical protein
MKDFCYLNTITLNNDSSRLKFELYGHLCVYEPRKLGIL